MFNTLVESRAKRTRSTKGTVASVLLHGIAIAVAVIMTMATKGDAKPQPPEKPIIFIPAPTPPPPIAEPTPTEPSHQPPPPKAPWTIVAPKDMPPMLPPIDLSGPPIPDDVLPRIIGGGVDSPFHPGPKTAPAPGTVVNFDAVERIPGLLGNARAPRYPDALRQSNIDGKVSVRFVVDTLGRAEMDGVEIVETSHPLFAESVKNALAFYRFSPGEVSGRKVRTMVQIPFTFSLTK